jgi:hypothetical protein
VWIPGWTTRNPDDFRRRGSSCSRRSPRWPPANQRQRRIVRRSRRPRPRRSTSTESPFRPASVPDSSERAASDGFRCRRTSSDGCGGREDTRLAYSSGLLRHLNSGRLTCYYLRQGLAHRQMSTAAGYRVGCGRPRRPRSVSGLSERGCSFSLLYYSAPLRWRSG